MSESRIEELRQISDDPQFPSGLSCEQQQELFAHIDALTRERDELKAALSRILHHHKRPADTFCGMVERLKTMARTALAATASGKGGSS